MNLLERLGGPDAVRRLSDDLYDRLLADDELGPIFTATHMPTQRQAFADYLTGAFAGDPTVPGSRLRTAHARHQVTDRHFSIMASHLADLLDASHVDAGVAADVLDVIAEHRADIVNNSVVADAWEPIDPTV